MTSSFLCAVRPLGVGVTAEWARVFLSPAFQTPPETNGGHALARLLACAVAHAGKKRRAKKCGWRAAFRRWSKADPAGHTDRRCGGGGRLGRRLKGSYGMREQECRENHGRWHSCIMLPLDGDSQGGLGLREFPTRRRMTKDRQRPALKNDEESCMHRHGSPWRANILLPGFFSAYSTYIPVLSLI